MESVLLVGFNIAKITFQRIPLFKSIITLLITSDYLLFIMKVKVAGM